MLLQSLNSQDINIARTAAFLGKTNNQAAINLLTKRLENIDSKFFAQETFGGSDRTGETWTTHIKALAHIAPKNAIRFLRDKLSEDGGFDTITTMVTDAPSLLMKLDSEAMLPKLVIQLQNAQDKHQILNLIQEAREYESIASQLIQILAEEEDESIQVRIVKVLGQSNTKLVTEALIGLLGHSSPQLSQEACHQLIKRKIKQTHELERLLVHEDWNVAWAAALVLGSLGHEIALPIISDAIQHHEEVGIRITAAKVLGKINSSRSISYLIDALHDENPHVRRQAAFSLSNFDRQEAIPELMLALTVGYLDARTNGIRSLARLKVEEPLWNMLYEKVTGWQTAAVELVKLNKIEALPNLCQALVDLGSESSDEVIDLLSKLADIKTLNWLLDALENPEQYTADPYFCNRVALVLSRCHPDIVEEKILHLTTLLTRKYIPQLSWVIPAIQNRCKFYNYEIWQEAVQHGKVKRQTSQMASETKNNFSGVTFNAPVNFGDNPTGDFIGTQNNYATDPEVQGAIADLQTFLTQLQTQHPHVTTETQALAIINAEFTEIKQSKTHRLVTLRKQLLNPERHLQATKAALGEVAKHYLEESLWAKAGLTYLDKLSEEPNRGI